MLSSTLIRTTQLPSGEAVPFLGQASWVSQKENTSPPSRSAPCVMVSNSAGSHVSAAFSEVAA
jgi:hypothetical protein